MLPAVPGILPGTSGVVVRDFAKRTRVLRPVRRVGYPARRVGHPPYPNASLHCFEIEVAIAYLECGGKRKRHTALECAGGARRVFCTVALESPARRSAPAKPAWRCRFPPHSTWLLPGGFLRVVFLPEFGGGLGWRGRPRLPVRASRVDHRSTGDAVFAKGALRRSPGVPRDAEHGRLDARATRTYRFEIEASHGDASG